MKSLRPRGAVDMNVWTRIIEEDLLHPVHHNVLADAWEDDSTFYRCCRCQERILGIVCEVSVGRNAHFVCAGLKIPMESDLNVQFVCAGPKGPKI